MVCVDNFLILGCLLISNFKTLAHADISIEADIFYYLATFSDFDSLSATSFRQRIIKDTIIYDVLKAGLKFDCKY